MRKNPLLKDLVMDEDEWLKRQKKGDLKIEISKQEVLQKLRDFKNPYPKDIFRWDNKDKLDFNRGRFNQHCFEIVENIRNKLIKKIEKL